MFVKGFKSGFLIVTIALLAAFMRAGESDDKQKLSQDMVATIHGFAKHHGLSDDQAWSLIGEMVIAGPKIKKAGVGAIGNKTYVLVDAKKNKLLFGNTQWEGRDSSDSEIVLTDGTRVLDSIESKNHSNVQIVIFAPEEVRYVDLSSNTGGKFTRTVK